MAEIILGFNIEWYDNISNMIQNLFLKFFVADNTIEILKEKSAFLKRIYYPDVKFSDLYLGNTLTIHNRLYTIKNYANKFTIEFMQDHETHFVGVISATDLYKIGDVINLALKSNLVVSKIFTTQLDSAIDSYGKDDTYIAVNPQDTVIEFVGISLDQTTRGIHFDDFIQRVQRNISNNILFARRPVENIQSTFKNCRGLITTTPCTLCLIKPHLYKSDKLGNLLNYISQNYQINGLFSIHLTIPMTEEFFDAYRGVVNEYSAMIENVASGPVLAVTISSKNSRGEDYGLDIVTSFREFCGPNHPELARILRPDSIRAKFGSTLLNNAVHCTDLSDDGEMESRYFFDTLANL